MADLFKRYFEYSRVVSTQIITEDGAYKKDQVPDAYSANELEVEVCHAITMALSNGEMIILELDVPEAMDNEGNTGGPVIRDGVEIKSGTGAPTIQTTRINTNMTEERNALAAWTKGQADAEATANSQIKT